MVNEMVDGLASLLQNAVDDMHGVVDQLYQTYDLYKIYM